MRVKCLQQKQVQVNLRKLHVQLPLEKKLKCYITPVSVSFLPEVSVGFLLFWEFVYFEMMFRMFCLDLLACLQEVCILKVFAIANGNNLLS